MCICNIYIKYKIYNFYPVVNFSLTSNEHYCVLQTSNSLVTFFLTKKKLIYQAENLYVEVYHHTDDS